MDRSHAAGEYVEDKSCCPCAPMDGQRSSCFRAVCSVSARDSTEGSCAVSYTHLTLPTN